MKKPPFKPKRGFTYIEMVMVVMVLGVIAGLAAPVFQATLEKTQLKRAAYQLAAEIRRARNGAVTTSIQHSVVFQLSSNSYWSDELDHIDHPGTPLNVGLQSGGYPITIISATFTGATGNGDTDVSFTWSGDPISPGMVVLGLGSDTLTITVNGAGNVEVGP